MGGKTGGGGGGGGGKEGALRREMVWRGLGEAG